LQCFYILRWRGFRFSQKWCNRHILFVYLAMNGRIKWRFGDELLLPGNLALLCVYVKGIGAPWQDSNNNEGGGHGPLLFHVHIVWRQPPKMSNAG
jgi:hypothetical protein